VCNFFILHAILGSNSNELAFIGLNGSRLLPVGLSIGAGRVHQGTNLLSGGGLLRLNFGNPVV